MEWLTGGRAPSGHPRLVGRLNSGRVVRRQADRLNVVGVRDRLRELESRFFF